MRALGRSERETVETFVALMRGINVGSTRKLPMADLRALSVKIGLQHPETYMQSGNLIVDADKEADEVRGVLEKAIAKRFNLRVDVIVRRASQWNRYVTANPFANDAATVAKMLHLFLSRDPLKPTAAKELEQKAQAGERIAIARGVLWIDYGVSGVGKSKLTPLLVDKACGSPATGRNWNSVLKIGEIIEARG
jgi:uncharacterized protein (DUF1697 family)